MSLETTRRFAAQFPYRKLQHRPRAWHNDPALRARLGLEDNHYDEPIPHQEVVRRLFSWKAISVPKANLIPCAKADANWFYEMVKTDKDGNTIFDEDGNPVKVTQPVRVSPTDSEQGIVRSGYVRAHCNSLKQVSHSRLRTVATSVAVQRNWRHSYDFGRWLAKARCPSVCAGGTT